MWKPPCLWAFKMWMNCFATELSQFWPFWRSFLVCLCFLYVPVNDFSVTPGQFPFFLGWTSIFEGQNLFLLVDPLTVIFRKVEKKSHLISKIVVLFYLPTLNIICFVEKYNIFLRFCLYFGSDTVRSDCPIQIFRKMMKYLKI